MFDFEGILLRAKTDAENHFRTWEQGTGGCCCGQKWPCAARHFLEETVPAMVYALEGDEHGQ